MHATSDTSGEAYMTVNGVSQGFYVGGWKNAQPEIYPAGITFTGDMKRMQVFYRLYGYGATHTVVFKDITVTGCLWSPVGGVWTPINIPQLLAPWIAVAIVIFGFIIVGTRRFFMKRL
ncbi:MAG: hypothetical protein QW667_03415 [Candidatus Bathyarchaeia archaeon]